MNELKTFLQTYPSPKVVVCSTIKSGHIVPIKPIPTISGAEVHCAPDVSQKVSDLINHNKR